MSDTPNIHLGHGPDETINRNWDILDSVIRALSRQVIPENLIVQGDLDVTGNATIGGLLTAGGIASNGSVSGSLGLFGQVNVGDGGLQVTGPLTLPVNSLNPAWLAPGAATTGVWIGTAQTTPLGFSNPTLVELANAATSVSEDPNRWSLVLAQVTVRVQFGASGSAPNGTVTLTIRRGATDVQTRSFIYDASYLQDDGLDLDIPYTLVRLAKPGDTSNIWRVMGSLTQVGGGDPIDVLRTFAQVHVVQFR
jgi:hypothetical protein